VTEPDWPAQRAGSLEPLPPPDWPALLRERAAGYARLALANIGREFPTVVHHEMTGPQDLPRLPRELTPVFYGSFDWHSCVEMHWLLIRLLRVAADAVPADAIRSALNGQFSRSKLAAEARFIGSDAGTWQRPYGWGWALALVHETATWDDPDGRRWASALAPLGRAIGRRYLAWLPKATYPVRHGVHANSAFGLSLALPYARELARSGDPALAGAITAKAREWYAADTRYPGGYEPSGHDFLSPALTEAELMARILPPGSFGAWLAGFLPGIEAGEPAALFAPAVVSDSADGQIAHLHGLNASRAWCWRRIAGSLPPGDPRTGPALAAARRHAEAALPHVVGDDYMVEHWLAAYAVLVLSLDGAGNGAATRHERS
jgi:hypothetical protein